ncbi:MAG: hypothetical protein ABJB01_00980 [Rudaea sp.]
MQRINFACAIFLTAACAPLFAQTVLPSIDVTAPRWEAHHGGYVISSNFTLDPKLSAVVFPAEPLKQGDIVFVKTQNLKDDEYFVLQECSSADCTMGHILRVWKRSGAIGVTAHDLNRVSIPHEGKFFMWMQRFPMSSNAYGSFTGYDAFSPPLVLNPAGAAEQFQASDVKAAQERGPEKVTDVEHDGMDFLIRYESGTTVFVQRMHAEN